MNKLLRIKDLDGNLMEGQNDVMTLIWNFYDNLYTAEPNSSVLKCLNVVSNCINTQMNYSLISLVLSSEVEKVVFDLRAYKALEPDGLNGLFFQKKLGYY